MTGRVRQLVFSLVLLGLLPALRAQVGETFSGEVVRVTDGDTISVMRDGRAVRVRVDGIDCPETGQDFSRRATRLTSSLVFGKVVTVDLRDVDRYGRLVGRVLVEGTDLSVALVQQGLAWHYTQYSRDPVLANAEAAARAARIAIWSQPSPIPPWEFRRGGNASLTDAATDGVLHGNRRSKVFHRPGCPNYNCPNCIIGFETLEDATAAGFRPAGDCHDLSSPPPSSTSAPAATSQDGPFHRNRRSKVFHQRGCRNYSCKNCTAIFQTREETITAGFRPAGDCHR